MESGPAIFAATAFGLFGAALLLWTGARARHRRPVVEGADLVASTALAVSCGVLFLLLGAWCLTRA
ncbi:hypothetical protein ACPXCE_28660 [Streptomyces sp. DT24]|uniref:hypothetical protein n=1 Tax=unclassified Streptomyces TaxID=2593676 RepID=UPI0023B8C541|nr:hypothetical protein [Streptomyces sp. AM 4-1-1]WEH35065.1 hypothetical protein PZB75_17905 [Streptomyces sp. AM 4-1-1]